MTQEEAINKLRDICATNDNETAHIEADDLLCEILRQLGWNELADEFRKQSDSFWYA